MIQARPELQARVRRLLQLINPGDFDLAREQYSAFAAELAETDDESLEDGGVAWLLKEIIDWESGFYVDHRDCTALVHGMDAMSTRWDVPMAWGVRDPTDETWLAKADPLDLLKRAHAAFAAGGYTLWTWDTDAPAHAGWIGLSSDDAEIAGLADALQIRARPASQPY